MRVGDTGWEVVTWRVGILRDLIHGMDLVATIWYTKGGPK